MGMAGLDDGGRAGVGTTRKYAPEPICARTQPVPEPKICARTQPTRTPAPPVPSTTCTIWEGGRDRRCDALQRRSYGARREASNANPKTTSRTWCASRAAGCGCGLRGVAERRTLGTEK